MNSREIRRLWIQQVNKEAIQAWKLKAIIDHNKQTR